jgi:hypothetical protein
MQEAISIGWIQWKGTEVCMDIHCKCGKMTHIDADFAYNVKCVYCGRIYACDPYVKLTELDAIPTTNIVTTTKNESDDD